MRLSNLTLNLNFFITCLLVSMVFMPLTVNANKNENELALNQLHNDIQKIIQKQNIPGFAYAIVENGKAPVVDVVGFTDMQKQKPISINTPFRLASVSKLIVGIAAMQQIEKGNLSLDDRLDKLLPWLEYQNGYSDTNPILLKHVLENTTGWNEASFSERASERAVETNSLAEETNSLAEETNSLAEETNSQAVNSNSMSIKEALARSAGSRQSRWQPGTRFAYTNTAATVVAAIIEESTGMPFYEYVQAEIFEPLALSSASYQENKPSMPLGHKGNRAVPYRHFLFAPSGALNMSIADMAILANEFVSTKPTLLSKASIKRMEMSTSTNAGQFDAGYGIYNYARYYDGHRYRGHDGATQGWLAEFSYSPKYGKGFVVFQNSENNRAFRSIVSLLHAYLASSYETPEIASQKRTENRALSGYYRMVNPRMQERWFLERLLTSHYLAANESKASLRSVFPKGWTRELYFIGNDKDSNFKNKSIDLQWVNSKNEVVMKVVNDPALGQVIHYGDRIFKKESAFAALIDKFVLAVWLVFFLGFLVTSFVWLIQLTRHKLLANKDDMNARIQQRKNLMLALSGPSLFILFLVLGVIAPVERLGNISLFSLGLFLSSMFFFATTIFSAYFHIKIQRCIQAKVFFVFGMIFLILQMCVVLYLLNFGAIGIMTWR